MNDSELICVHLMNFTCHEVLPLYLDLNIVSPSCVLSVKDSRGGKLDIVTLSGATVKWSLESYFLFVNSKG